MAEAGSYTFSYRRMRRDDLTPADLELVDLAARAAYSAYAPYSNFFVGAALRLKDGSVVTGNNQENASFPAGICAERSALHAAMSANSQGVVATMAVVVPQVKGDVPVSPCGICRQALLEQEFRQGEALRVLLATAEGTVVEIAKAGDLLPLHFDRSFLKA